MTTSSIQKILTFHSRKLLHFPISNQSSGATLTSVAPPPGSFDQLERTAGKYSLGADIVMVLTVLLCALICSHVFNAIIMCALKCSRSVSPHDDSGHGSSSHLAVGKLARPGISKKALKTFPVVNYSGDLKIPGLESECVICLMEFSPGEKIRILPKCNHGFHAKCIDRWLNCHSSCPICRHCLIETCNKILAGGNSNVIQSNIAALPPGPSQEIIINIAPLEPEGMVQNCPS